MAFILDLKIETQGRKMKFASGNMNVLQTFKSFYLNVIPAYLFKVIPAFQSPFNYTFY